MVEHYLNILSGVNYHTREANTFIFYNLSFYKQLAGCMHESIATLRYDDGKLGRRRETIPEVIFQM